MDSLFANSIKKYCKRNITEILHLYYDCVKPIDFLRKKYKILLYWKQYVEKSKMKKRRKACQVV